MGDEIIGSPRWSRPTAEHEDAHPLFSKRFSLTAIVDEDVDRQTFDRRAGIKDGVNTSSWTVKNADD
ncbi:MAG TPA: hypothetical protein VFP91_08790 [Vicinamibacterales bacterium]|nr:hypothetical protein [Vicinamibacterales bacterium]